MDSYAERLDYFGEFVFEEEKCLVVKNILCVMFEFIE